MASSALSWPGACTLLACEDSEHHHLSPPPLDSRPVRPETWAVPPPCLFLCHGFALFFSKGPPQGNPSLS